ncbi:MAG: response regulator [Candidatus Promineifilaceae bacterium]
MANVLVVDDAILTQRLLEVMLRRINHKTIQALNGLEALARLKDNAVDLVITDINMPEMDGLSFLDELRADSSHKNLPVIVMTASGLPYIPQMVTKKGATIFLAQPFSSRELTEAVTKCLEKNVVN